MPPARVFRRSTVPDPPVAVSASGSTIVDAAGRRYLDAAGGAIVVSVGHGRQAIADAMAAQASRVAYAHGSAFTSQALEAYASELGPHLPLDDAAIYPVSGGSESIETALKLARAYHLARGEPERTRVIARWGSYHGNSLGALDLSGRDPLRRPYEPWLGRFEHVSAAYPYRAGEPDAHALGDPAVLADELERTITSRPGTVAAFVAEPIVGATLGAVVPHDGYWPRIAEVCRRHGVLLIADEVMTGFGRTGRWFGVDHWGIRPDLLVAAKGASSGYWPFGFVAASGAVHATMTAPGTRFVHGFTYSHHPVGAAVARAVLAILEQESLVEASALKGEQLRERLGDRLGSHPRVGEIRGRGLMVGIELVEDRATRRAFVRSAQVAERLVAEARERGLLVYWGTGSATGIDGDTLLLGPPFVVTDDELDAIVDRLAVTVEDVLGR
ncbi:MAG TPA: aminotransferase class III-fold pyridoxal phosphate-dependent enzyme [Candidatus Limnocylindrales bacterium]|nr:aminotransferase class III-fold pyridoxal phosphate-dependent enzyme [Candidatus Limnocylindrales bacterium]